MTIQTAVYVRRSWFDFLVEYRFISRKEIHDRGKYVRLQNWPINLIIGLQNTMQLSKGASQQKGAERGWGWFPLVQWQLPYPMFIISPPIPGEGGLMQCSQLCMIFKNIAKMPLPGITPCVKKYTPLHVSSLSDPQWPWHPGWHFMITHNWLWFSGIHQYLDVVIVQFSTQNFTTSPRLFVPPRQT